MAAPYELQLREWELTDSFVRAVVAATEIVNEEYLHNYLDAVVQEMHPPVRTGELEQSLTVVMESAKRGKIVMAYYGVWVDRGHRVITPTMKGDRYRVRGDLTGDFNKPSSYWAARTKPANFIRKAFASPRAVAAKQNIMLALRRRQSN